MSQGRRVAPSEPDQGGGQVIQPQGGEHGVGTSYARLDRGLDRKLLHQGSLTHADMGTSQQLNKSLRKGEASDPPTGRDMLTPRASAMRPVSQQAGGVPPVQSTRTSSRPPSSPFGNLISPRHYHSNSYRDAALVAAQHGLSAYAQSAAAAATRSHNPRSGCGGAGRPPPAPRPVQHSAPLPNANQPLSSEFLPSCSGASPSRGGMPPNRTGLLQSRGSAPTASSPSRPSDTPPVSTHRSSDVAMVTVTYNDLSWRGAFEHQHEQDDGMATSQTVRPPSRVMSPGWGAAPPSVYEADGRPGTRGGGPQYDMDGRPTTRGGQRPPSRAQLNLSHTKPPSHVAPLGGAGWAGMFSGGSGTGSGEPASTSTSPQAPSAGSCVSWSGEAPDPAALHRRQLLPLPPSVSAGSAGFSTPPGPRATGVLSSLAPAQPAGPHSNHTAQLPPGQPPGHVGPSSGGSNGSVTGTGRPYNSMLSSIAEAPSSPAVPSLKSLVGRLDSAGGRKASREREPSLPAGPLDRDSAQASLDGISEEGVNDDSYLSNLDQDGSNRGSGRMRARRISASTQSGSSYRQYGSHSGDEIGGTTQGLGGPNSPTHENPPTRPRR